MIFTRGIALDRAAEEVAGSGEEPLAAAEEEDAIAGGGVRCRNATAARDRVA